MVKEGGKNREHAPAITDERFSRLHTDPRFLRPNREEAKVIIDDRFKGLLTGKGSGKKKAKLDKYGRKTQANGRSGGDEEMRRLYRLEDGGKDGGESNSGSGSEVSSNSNATVSSIGWQSNSSDQLPPPRRSSRSGKVAKGRSRSHHRFIRRGSMDGSAGKHSSVW